MDLGLAERVFILTGASRGLGFATARALVADGARVVVSSRDPERVDDAVAALGSSTALGVTADLTDPETPRELVDAAMERFGRLDGALISVGGPARGTAAEMTDDQWRQAFDTVFLGSVRAARTFARAMPGGLTRATTDGLVVPLRYDAGGRELSFFSITSVLGTPLDITLSELAVESFLPADAATAAALTGGVALSADGSRPG